MARTYKLPRPISVNSIFKNTPSNGRARSKAYRDWAKAADGIMLIQPGREKTPGAVKLAFMVDRSWRGDIDNCLKAWIDLLVHCDLIDDDRNVQHITIAKGEANMVMIEGMEDG